ncbi:MAG: HDOD domain-containing protein [Caldimicrobium sp.]|nr:HDOD domain-containing protein [Caldimicrobium sp.]MDW8093898.1 HDOD domain-containing protein [Caldimicrobium sp.]
MGSLEQLIKREQGALLPFPELGIKILQTYLNKSEREWEEFLHTEGEVKSFLLSTANKPRFRKSGEPITTLRGALLVLGDTTTKILTIGLIAKKLMKNTLNEFSFPKFWSRALTQLIAGFFLADLLENFPRHIPVASYLMDFGIIVMYFLNPQKYLQVLKRKQEGISLLEAEREIFGITHQDIVAEYFENYTLPRRFILNLRYHHEISEEMIPREIQEDLHLLRMIDAGCGSFFGFNRELRWKNFIGLAQKYLTSQEIEAFGEIFPKIVNSYLELFNLEEFKLKTLREWQEERERELQRIKSEEGMEGEREKENTEILLEEYENKLLALARERRDLENKVEFLSKKLEEVSIYEEHTKVYKETYFLKRVKEELLRTRRYGKVFSLLCIDIADFPKIVGKIGLTEEEGILRNIAQELTKNLRRTDLIAKSSTGYVFYVLLTETPSQGAMVVARKLLRKIEEFFYKRYREKILSYISVITYSPKIVDIKKEPNEINLLHMLKRGIELLKSKSQSQILLLKLEQDIEG